MHQSNWSTQTTHDCQGIYPKIPNVSNMQMSTKIIFVRQRNVMEKKKCPQIHQLFIKIHQCGKKIGSCADWFLVWVNISDLQGCNVRHHKDGECSRRHKRTSPAKHMMLGSVRSLFHPEWPQFNEDLTENVHFWMKGTSGEKDIKRNVHYVTIILIFLVTNMRSSVCVT